MTQNKRFGQPLDDINKGGKSWKQIKKEKLGGRKKRWKTSRSSF
jgi:hypothetical protein